jgi:hypothetical protein
MLFAFVFLSLVLCSISANASPVIRRIPAFLAEQPETWALLTELVVHPLSLLALNMSSYVCVVLLRTVGRSVLLSLSLHGTRTNISYTSLGCKRANWC